VQLTLAARSAPRYRNAGADVLAERLAVVASAANQDGALSKSSAAAGSRVALPRAHAVNSAMLEAAALLQLPIARNQGGRELPPPLEAIPAKWAALYGDVADFRPTGRGGFSDVYVVRRGEVPTCALKVLRDPDSLDFRREVSIMRELRDCRFFIRYFDSVEMGEPGWEGGKDMILMEAGDMTVFDAIERFGPLYEAQAIEVTIDLLCGLQVVDARGFVYRDVKPENILVTLNYVKFGDLGGACTPGAHSPYPCEGYFGTLMFSSPQMWEEMTRQGVFQTSHITQTHKDDIFALGITLMFMVSGGKVPKEVQYIEELLGDTETPHGEKVLALRAVWDDFDITSEPLLAEMPPATQVLLTKMLSASTHTRCTATECLEFVADVALSGSVFSTEDRKQASQCVGASKKRPLLFGGVEPRASKRLKLNEGFPA